MQDFKDITSALCDVHVILTHLVGIGMADLRCQAKGLENIAFQTVNKLADMALVVDKRRATPKEFSDFEDLHQCVSTILLRAGLDSELQDRRRLLKKLKPGSDELAKTLEGLSIEHKAVEAKTTIDLV